MATALVITIDGVILVVALVLAVALIAAWRIARSVGRRRRPRPAPEPCENCGEPGRYVVVETFDDDGEGNALPPGFGCGMSASYCRRHAPANAQRVA